MVNILFLFLPLTIAIIVAVNFFVTVTILLAAIPANRFVIGTVIFADILVVSITILM